MIGFQQMPAFTETWRLTITVSPVKIDGDS